MVDLQAFRYDDGRLVACENTGLGGGPMRLPDGTLLDGHLVFCGPTALVLYLPPGEEPEEDLHGDDLRAALAEAPRGR